MTATCNQKCEYCYLTKHGEKIYPFELRNSEQILHNLKLLLAYILKKDYDISTFDIFSGEVWATDFGISALEILLEYVKTTKHVPNMVCIPSNCSFILNEEYFPKICQLIDAYEYYGCKLVFSASIDGPILEVENRSFRDESKNVLRDDSFYTKLFEFCKKYNFGFHPMVNAYSIERWPEQYDWWLDKLNEYEFNYFAYIMFLEVRNDEWTHEKIKSYLYFLNHAYEAVKEKIFNGNSEEMARCCLMSEGHTRVSQNYFHLGYMSYSPRMGCTIDRTIMIRLGDLSWVPCHRTSYDKFLYGKFIVEDDQIVGMEGLNLPLLFSIYGLAYGGHPKCDTCHLGRMCTRGCYGAQYEAHKELFYPCDTVCDLMKAKLLFLYQKLKKDLEAIDCKTLLDEVERLHSKIRNEEDYKAWMPVIEPLI